VDNKKMFRKAFLEHIFISISLKMGKREG